MSAGKAKRAYKFIDAHRDGFSAPMMCQLLGVARTGHYAWREQRVPTQKWTPTDQTPWASNSTGER